MKRNDFLNQGGKHVRASYCSCTEVLKFFQRKNRAAFLGAAYGVYGWNSDNWVLLFDNGRKIILSTGYRPYKGIDPDYKELRKLEDDLDNGKRVSFKRIYRVLTGEEMN